ncbi:MAG: cytochrome P460 family protein [Fimbriiglobus sp.]
MLLRLVMMMVLVAVAFVGCKRPEPTNSSVTNATNTAVTPTVVEPKDFASWPRILETPMQVSPVMYTYCRAMPTPEQAAREEKESQAATKTHGPHHVGAIQMRVSPASESAFREGRALPVGTVIVKEKYDFASPETPMNSYALMTKREPGYFPDGGDWEYTFVTLNPERKVTTGKLMNCASCHHNAAKDYLFRTYIK